jgi:cobalt-precorrin 5A hydrolase
MTIAFFSFTDRGAALAERLRAFFEGCGHSVFTPPDGLGPREQAAAAFRHADALVFAGAVGIAVRLVAPFVRSKTDDPAVIAADEAGRWVIPLLGGHGAGANALAREAAAFLGAEAVVTTATDINGVFAVDLWALERGFAIGSTEAAKRVSASLLRGEEVVLQSDCPSDLPIDTTDAPETTEGTLPRGIVLGEVASVRDTGRVGILVSMGRHEEHADVLRLVPRRLYVGIGCRRGASEEAIARAVDAALMKAGLDGRCVAGLASIDVKRDEAGLLAFGARRGLGCRFFSAEELRGAEGGFGASAFVLKAVGVDNVCERAAVLASGGRLVIRKTALDGITVALALRASHNE